MDHVSWSIGLFSKTTSLEVGLTQNHRETTALEVFIIVDLFYRNTMIASSPPGKRIYIFETTRFASQKLNFSDFLFSKKSIKMTLNGLEVTKCCKN